MCVVKSVATIDTLTRAPLGGLFRATPSRFLATSYKPIQVSPPNFQYPLSQQFYTLYENFKVQGIIVWLQMTSEWRHVPPISTENKGLQKCRHGCSFKATIDCLIWNDVELVGLQNCYLGFSKYWKFTNFFSKFSTFIFLFKNFPLNIKIFKKTVQYVRGQ